MSLFKYLTDEQKQIITEKALNLSADNIASNTQEYWDCIDYYINCLSENHEFLSEERKDIIKQIQEDINAFRSDFEENQEEQEYDDEEDGSLQQDVSATDSEDSSHQHAPNELLTHKQIHVYESLSDIQGRNKSIEKSTTLVSDDALIKKYEEYALEYLERFPDLIELFDQEQEDQLSDEMENNLRYQKFVLVFEAYQKLTDNTLTSQQKIENFKTHLQSGISSANNKLILAIERDKDLIYFLKCVFTLGVYPLLHKSKGEQLLKSVGITHTYKQAVSETKSENDQNETQENNPPNSP